MWSLHIILLPGYGKSIALTWTLTFERRAHSYSFPFFLKFQVPLPHPRRTRCLKAIFQDQLDLYLLVVPGFRVDGRKCEGWKAAQRIQLAFPVLESSHAESARTQSSWPEQLARPPKKQSKKRIARWWKMKKKRRYHKLIPAVKERKTVLHVRKLKRFVTWAYKHLLLYYSSATLFF